MSNYDPLDLRGQERVQADKAVRDKLGRENEEGDVRWLMGSKRGRRIVWRLLDQAGVFRLSFNPNALQMAFAEGTRNYGLHMLALIHSLCPELYPTMVRENATDASDSRESN